MKMKTMPIFRAFLVMGMADAVKNQPNYRFLGGLKE